MRAINADTDGGFLVPMEISEIMNRLHDGEIDSGKAAELTCDVMDRRIEDMIGQ